MDTGCPIFAVCLQNLGILSVNMLLKGAKLSFQNLMYGSE